MGKAILSERFTSHQEKEVDREAETLLELFGYVQRNSKEPWKKQYSIACVSGEVAVLRVHEELEGRIYVELVRYNFIPDQRDMPWTLQQGEG